MSAAYSALCSAAKGLALPRSYESDLHKYDKRTLANVKNLARPFAWLLYANGTHLIWLDGGEEAGRVLDMIHDSFANTTTTPWQWFHWDGSLLRPATIDQLRSL